MIDWFRRARAEGPFLKSADRDWNYAETIVELESRIGSGPRSIRPDLSPESVFDVLSGIAGGGAVLLGPTDREPHLPLAGSRLVVFTSGTSGGPKGVRLTLENLEKACQASMTHLGHDHTDTWLLAMPLSHVGGVSILIRSAFAGGSVRLLGGFDPATFAEALHQDVTMVSIVPAMLSRLLDYYPGPYRGQRAVLVGGGPIPDGLLDRATEAGLPVLPSYGMSETFGQVATLKPGSPIQRRAHPLPGIELSIDEDGLIAVRGAQVSPGYLGEPDRASDWLVTNDLGVLEADGALRVVGRADTVIVTGGENVDPARVESELAALPGVEEAIVVGIPDETWGEVVAAVYQGTANPEMLRSALAVHLPRYMVPSRWRVVGEIPRTGLGKPDRAAAVALFV